MDNLEENIAPAFLDTRLIGNSMETWLSRWKLTCYRKVKIHFQKIADACRVLEGWKN